MFVCRKLTCFRRGVGLYIPNTVGTHISVHITVCATLNNGVSSEDK